MRFLDNTPDSYHEELKSYFPAWYSRVKEMDAIWKITGEMLDEFKADMLKGIQNASLATCDVDTIRKLQDWAGASFNTAMTDDIIRMLFYMQIAGFGKCSRSKIIRLMRQLLGTESDVSFVPYNENGDHVLKIFVNIGDSENWDPDDIEMLLDRIVPAHILRETHHQQLFNGQAQTYAGLALHPLSVYKANVDAPDFEHDVIWLVDEDENMLIDELGGVLFSD